MTAAVKKRGAGRSRTDDGGFAIRCLSHLATAPCPCRVESPGGGLIESYCRQRCRSRGSKPGHPGVPCGARNCLRLTIMKNAKNDKMPQTKRVEESEEQLVSRAQDAVSQCRWVVGECAARWTERYARGRTDGDFAALIGLSGDQ